MNTLAALLSWVVSQLQTWLGASNVRVIETDAFSEDQFHLKVRANLAEPYQFQIRFYYNRGHLDYAYQLFADAPVLRWDNKEDAGERVTAPHHFHNEADEIRDSPLTGDPTHDWPLVRTVVDRFLETHTESIEHSTSGVRRLR